MKDYIEKTRQAERLYILVVLAVLALVVTFASAVAGITIVAEISGCILGMLVIWSLFQLGRFLRS